MAGSDSRNLLAVLSRGQFTAYGIQRRCAPFPRSSRSNLELDTARQCANHQPGQKHYGEGKQVFCVGYCERPVRRHKTEVEDGNAQNRRQN